jgi:nitroimidazol reductase NimA-like FMN-containing flavoprotein (pyridoxamine 5'-phosphate oxidase superfamily)
MTRHEYPLFREVDANEAKAILARNHVGRIAYTFHDRVDIEPISYVFAGGAIYVRTSPGSKLATLAHMPWVAFEVDEFEGPFDWRSVVAHGTVYPLHEDGSLTERATYRLAVQELRELVPRALEDDDPTPARRVLLRLQPSELTGREARTATGHAEKAATRGRGSTLVH